MKVKGKIKVKVKNARGEEWGGAGETLSGKAAGRLLLVGEIKAKVKTCS